MLFFCAPGYQPAPDSPIQGTSFMTPDGGDPKLYRLICRNPNR